MLRLKYEDEIGTPLSKDIEDQVCGPDYSGTTTDINKLINNAIEREVGHKPVFGELREACSFEEKGNGWLLRWYGVPLLILGPTKFKFAEVEGRAKVIESMEYIDFTL